MEKRNFPLAPWGEGVRRTGEGLHIVYFSLGSNLGDKSANLTKAIEMMEKQIGVLVRQSAFLETEPWGFESDNSFVNAAISMETELEPIEVLDRTQEIERQLGRNHKSVNGEYHDRLIDIDILLYDDIHIKTDRLTIPHPLMRERDFVMIPLREIVNIN